MNTTDISSLIKLVQEGLNLSAYHDTFKYNFIIQQIKSNNLEKITLWLQALTQCTTLIQPCHSDLLHALYTIPLPQSQQTIDIYFTLLLHMITANTAFVNGVIHSLFSRVVPENSQLFPLFLTVCQKIVTLVPLSVQYFVSNFQRCMPNKWKTIQQFTTYIEFFRTSFPQMPQIGEQCLMACIDMLISYDTDLQKNGDMFELDETDSIGKLNELLTYVLGWIETLPQQLEQALFKSFETCIAKTQFILYTPIVYLFYCSTEERCNKFVTFLLSQISQHNRQSNSVELYVCHLGSFVSNSALLSAASTFEIIQRIGRIFAEERNMTIKILLCQQVFKIINSKCIELETRMDITQLFISSGVVARMIVDQCNPFGNCSQRTVKEFIHLCKTKKLMDPQQLLAENALLVDPQFISCPLVSYDPYDVPMTWKQQTTHLLVQRTPFEDDYEINEIEPMSLEKNSWDFTL